MVQITSQYSVFGLRIHFCIIWKLTFLHSWTVLSNLQLLTTQSSYCLAFRCFVLLFLLLLLMYEFDVNSAAEASLCLVYDLWRSDLHVPSVMVFIDVFVLLLCQNDITVVYQKPSYPIKASQMTLCKLEHGSLCVRGYGLSFLAKMLAVYEVWQRLLQLSVCKVLCTVSQTDSALLFHRWFQFFFSVIG